MEVRGLGGFFVEQLDACGSLGHTLVASRELLQCINLHLIVRACFQQSEVHIATLEESYVRFDLLGPQYNIPVSGFRPDHLHDMYWEPLRPCFDRTICISTGSQRARRILQA